MAVSGLLTAFRIANRTDAAPTASRGRWRRDALAVGLALLAHAVLLWLFIDRAPAPEARAWTMEMTLVDPRDAVMASSGTAGGGPVGEAQANGDLSVQSVERPQSGDGTKPGADAGGARLPAWMLAAMDPVVTPGEAAEAGTGDGDLAASGSTGAADNAYQRLLRKHIQPFRLYPSEAVRRRAEGVVVVRFRVGRGGEVEEAWVVRRSRDAALDRAALETLWRAEPMPVVPNDLPAPVEVELAMPFRLPGR